jgi:hypothetical protein
LTLPAHVQPEVEVAVELTVVAFGAEVDSQSSFLEFGNFSAVDCFAGLSFAEPYERAVESAAGLVGCIEIGELSFACHQVESERSKRFCCSAVEVSAVEYSAELEEVDSESVVE